MIIFKLSDILRNNLVACELYTIFFTIYRTYLTEYLSYVITIITDCVPKKSISNVGRAANLS